MAVNSQMIEPRTKPRLGSLEAILCVALLMFGWIETVLASSDNNDAFYWLERMQKSAVELNYRGTFMYSRGEMMSSMRVIHRFADGAEHERLTQLDGEMGEIIRHGSDLVCVFPGNRVVRLEKNQFANSVVKAFANFMPDHTYYELRVSNGQRLVDRTSVRLDIKARDKHRYSYVLWLDKATGLLLRSSLLSEQGNELERFQFANIEFPEVIAAEEIQPVVGGELIKHEVIPTGKKDSQWPSEMMWRVDWVPPGFAPTSEPGASAANTMLYSDGLATYSIFIEMVDEMMPEGASMMGATVAYAKKLSAGAHQYAVTVVGDIPPMTAMMVAESVKPYMPE